MIKVIALLSWVETFFSLVLLASGRYTDIAWLTAFANSLFNAILCTAFDFLKTTVKQQGEEIEKLKSHLGIKDGDPVNQNNENKND